MDVEIVGGTQFLMRPDEGQFILVAEHDKPLQSPGLRPPRPAVRDPRRGRRAARPSARRWQEKDDRLRLKVYDDLDTGNLVVHAFYVKYLLPIWFDVQCMEWKTDGPGPAVGARRPARADPATGRTAGVAVGRGGTMARRRPRGRRHRGGAVLDIRDTDRIRIITLNRPEALNAFNEALYDATTEALIAAADDPTVAVVVITGTGKAFSAGTDVKEMAQRNAGGLEPGQARLPRADRPARRPSRSR